MLSPELINQFDKASGLKTSPSQTTPNSRVSQLNSIAQQAQQNKSTSSPGEGFFSSPQSEQDPYQTGEGLTSPILPASGQEGLITGGLKSVANAPTSAVRVIQGLLSPSTYVGLGKDIAGGIQSIPGVSEWFDKHSSGQGQQVLQGNKDAFNNFTQSLGNQYGSWANIKRSVIEDPVGTALLLRGILEGGAKATSGASNLAEGAGMTKTAGALDTASGAMSKAGKIVAPIEKVAGGISKVSEVASNLKGGKPMSPMESAMKDTTPNYSKKLISESPVKNADGTTTPRVQESTGIFGGRSVTSTYQELAAAKELSKVPGYDPSATNLEKYNTVNDAISTEAKNLTSSLKLEKVKIPPAKITKVVTDAINKVPDESLLLQKSDPVIKSYTRVLTNAVKSADGSVSGILKVRKLMDSAYNNARGKMAFGSDKISALDDIHSAARNALNDYLIKSVKNTDVKASLQKQANLYRANDVLQNKAETEGNSTIERLTKKHPILKKGAEMAAKGAGLGLGVDILK